MTNPFEPAPPPAKQSSGISKAAYDAILEGLARALKEQLAKRDARIERLEKALDLEITKTAASIEQDAEEFTSRRTK